MLRNEAAIYVGNPADILGKNALEVIALASSQRLDSMPNVPTFSEQGYALDESMWRGFAFKKGVPVEAVDYVTKVLQAVANDEEWKAYCNETFVFSNFEGHNVFTERIIRETKETNVYLEKAGLLVSYIGQSSYHPVLVFLLIFLSMFLLLLAFNGFKLKMINYDQLIAGGIIIISAFFYYQTLLFQIPESVNITSPALIPRIWIIILIFLSVMLIIQSKNKKVTRKNHSPKIVLIIISFLVGYLVAMQWAGYFFTTPVFILAGMYLLNYRKAEVMLINAFGFVLFSYFVFSELLHIDLPLGWWFI
jgi:hypothetical protein